MKKLNALLVLFALLLTRGQVIAEAPATQPASLFGIQVIDDKTGRGVPMVELKTVSNVRYWTDSGGWVAIDDPAMMGKKVFFSVSSSGYEFPADGFGIRGRAIEVQPGGSAALKIKRINLAERLYRITGEGIYSDSVRLGKPVPIHEPLLNAQVTGQDSAHAVILGGKIHWFWGDTMRQGYPLGQFWTSGATSDLPGSGGLEPQAGIDLHYFTDDKGFSRPMLERSSQQPKWLDGVIVVEDPRPSNSQAMQLVGVASRVADVGKTLGRELVVYDSGSAKLVKRSEVPAEAPLFLRGHPFLVETEAGKYFYFGDVYPNMRVKANLTSIVDLSSYEGYTCLQEGSRYDKIKTSLDRNTEGALRWGWKRSTPPLEPEQQEQLIRSGKVKREELPFDLHDVATGGAVNAHRGSVCWNEFRKRWVMIACQQGSKTSFLGEIWYAESEKPEGPWRAACKIVTHDRYSFYNPLQHPFFDQEGGRIIYFEGTYTMTFSRENDPTPRYEYNQIMYRLDVSTCDMGGEKR